MDEMPGAGRFLWLLCSGYAVDISLSKISGAIETAADFQSGGPDGYLLPYRAEQCLRGAVEPIGTVSEL